MGRAAEAAALGGSRPDHAAGQDRPASGGGGGIDSGGGPGPARDKRADPARVPDGSRKETAAASSGEDAGLVLELEPRDPSSSGFNTSDSDTSSAGEPGAETRLARIASCCTGPTTAHGAHLRMVTCAALFPVFRDCGPVALQGLDVVASSPTCGLLCSKWPRRPKGGQFWQGASSESSAATTSLPAENDSATSGSYIPRQVGNAAPEACTATALAFRFTGRRP